MRPRPEGCAWLTSCVLNRQARITPKGDEIALHDGFDESRGEKAAHRRGVLVVPAGAELDDLLLGADHGHQRPQQPSAVTAPAARRGYGDPHFAGTGTHVEAHRPDPFTVEHADPERRRLPLASPSGMPAQGGAPGCATRAANHCAWSSGETAAPERLNRTASAAA